MPIKGREALERTLDALLPRPGAATDAALEAMRAIKQRTLSGKDVQGRPFKRYAAATRKDRTERGRQTAHVDLMDKGNMLAAMTVRGRGPNKAEITFANAVEAAKALGHVRGVGRLPKREFFGLSDDERQLVLKVIRDAVGKAR